MNRFSLVSTEIQKVRPEETFRLYPRAANLDTELGKRLYVTSPLSSPSVPLTLRLKGGGGGRRGVGVRPGLTRVSPTRQRFRSRGGRRRRPFRVRERRRHRDV